MPVFDAEIKVPIMIDYHIEEGKIHLNTILVYGTGQVLPLNNAMAERIVELCREDMKESMI